MQFSFFISNERNTIPHSGTNERCRGVTRAISTNGFFFCQDKGTLFRIAELSKTETHRVLGSRHKNPNSIEGEEKR